MNAESFVLDSLWLLSTQYQDFFHPDWCGGVIVFASVRAAVRIAANPQQSGRTGESGWANQLHQLLSKMLKNEQISNRKLSAFKNF